ncbi:5-oxoprolinase subunit PxpB [Vibrio sp. Y2-5]|uniref:5-oxoprolinase subunit PxpB n=1 Tax=Vibrio TaxID=662 RepID=UPI00142DF2B3|nr:MULTISPECIES: 5-oxoprolinase subunit PxpB [Vibrio]MBD0786688.1 5-oxoprolinase subunit PxpB [Vibrio sp. Y2-5]NIY93108.1 5-oxoprolinase subunit PxpB [Vibrio diazotrophicus]
MKVEVCRVSEASLMVYFGHSIDLKLIERIAAFSHAVKDQYHGKIYEVIPSYTTLLIEYNPLKIDIRELTQWCHLQADKIANSNVLPSKSKTVTFPVYYHPEVAPDLQSLASEKQMSVERLIEIHCQREYTVCAIGFAPGFAFLGTVDAQIATPRHAEPRLKVAKGSVGIADQQTAIYPQETPGGWKIIGNCPLALFDIESDPIMPFDVGDKVRFEPISKEQFLDLGGVV